MPGKPNRVKGTQKVFFLRLSAEERAMLQRVAETRRLSCSDLLRLIIATLDESDQQDQEARHG